MNVSLVCHCCWHESDVHRSWRISGVPHQLEKRFGGSVLSFSDPDGMRFALIGVPGAD